MKKILEIIIYGILIIILLMVGIQKISKNEKGLFGYRIFRVISLSMAPEYNINDILLVKEIDSTEIDVGDNIAYQDAINQQMIITHKVIGLEEDSNGELLFHTKGIANNIEDPIVKSEQIYGVVISKLYMFSIFIKLLNSIYGFILLILLPLGILIVKNIKELISMIKEKTDEK